MRLFAKLIRFIRKPQPYFETYNLLGYILTCWLYRAFVLPFAIFRVRLKKRVNVVFLAMNPDMWKYDGLYRKLLKDDRFNPIIVTAMRNITNMEVRLQEQEIMVDYFAKRGFNVIRGYDTVTKKWIELNNLAPDIIFYTQPYNGGIEPSLEFYNFWNSLHCYSPYSFQISQVAWNWDNPLQRFCWKVFYVSDIHLQMCKEFSCIGGVNARAVGYSLEEEYLEAVIDRGAAHAAWNNDGRKRIIWAPHHSIMEHEMFKVSSFLEIADLMVKLREEYKDRVVFAFKPHPVLKTKLYQIWGEDKTNRYYEDWASAENSFDAQGDYKALFAGSDAMIHCSGSFIVEYLYTGKPVAYVYSKVRNPPDIGTVGNAALGAHYPLIGEADIRRFIDDVVLGGHDTMSDIRKSVADKYLRAPNGKMFSENVYESILEGLGKKCPTR